MAPIALHTRLSAIALYLLAATTTTTDAHVLVPFSRNTEHHQLSARAENAVGQKLTSNVFAYVVKAAVGTPPQEVSLLVNPSYGDTWVPDANQAPCVGSSRYRYCSAYESRPELYNPEDWADNSPTCVEGYVRSAGSCQWGSYNKSLSSTYLSANSRQSSFSVSTIEQISVYGSNFTDKLVVGEIEVDDYPMGLTYSSTTRPIGVLGLGRNSSSSSTTGNYVNFIDRLVRSGKIKTPAYSIWLDNPEGSSGNLLFGAVDKSKYEGDLVRMYVSSSYTLSRTFGASINSINGTQGSGETMPAIRTNDFPLAVTISPGDVYSYLPSSIVDSMGKMVGAQYNSSLGLMTIPCDAATKTPVSFKIQLGSEVGPVLNVETADLVISGNVVTSSSKKYLGDKCIFGIQKWESSSSSSYTSSSYYYNIGSSLLRRAYMVFDIANREVAIAPVKFSSSSSSSDVVAFSKYKAPAPGSKSLDGYTYCESEDGYSYRTNTECWGSGTSSGSDPDRTGRSGSSGNSYPEANGVYHWEKVALGLGITFGLLILVSFVAAICICTRRSKAKKAASKEADVEGDASGDDAVPAATAAITRSAPGGGGPLPVIQEGREEMSQTAPQLPALAVTPPPAEEARQTSVLPEEQTQLPSQTQTQLPPQVEPSSAQTEQAEPAKVEDVKGKGKEVERGPVPVDN
ncbi:aspartic peptidase domain-containing protein [Cladorrhinum sp. PSN259]|nr:aspartic peptidase domain-containing protein [Cladorrhinum sp. PSN259]